MVVVVLSVAAPGRLPWLSPELCHRGVAAGDRGDGCLAGGADQFPYGKVREGDDHLYQDCQAMIDGRKELALNRARAARFYEEELDDHVRACRQQVFRLIPGQSDPAQYALLSLPPAERYFATLFPLV